MDFISIFCFKMSTFKQWFISVFFEVIFYTSGWMKIIVDQCVITFWYSCISSIIGNPLCPTGDLCMHRTLYIYIYIYFWASAMSPYPDVQGHIIYNRCMQITFVDYCGAFDLKNYGLFEGINMFIHLVFVRIIIIIYVHLALCRNR